MPLAFFRVELRLPVHVEPAGAEGVGERADEGHVLTPAGLAALAGAIDAVVRVMQLGRHFGELGVGDLLGRRFDAGSFYQIYIEALICRDPSGEGPAAAALTQMESTYADSRAFYIATVYAWCGDSESAFTWLDRAVESGQRTLGIRTEPMLKSLQADPRWEALLFRVGLADSQVQNIDFQL